MSKKLTKKELIKRIKILKAINKLAGIFTVSENMAKKRIKDFNYVVRGYFND